MEYHIKYIENHRTQYSIKLTILQDEVVRYRYENRYSENEIDV